MNWLTTYHMKHTSIWWNKILYARKLMKRFMIYMVLDQSNKMSEHIIFIKMKCVHSQKIRLNLMIEIIQWGPTKRYITLNGIIIRSATQIIGYSIKNKMRGTVSLLEIVRMTTYLMVWMMDQKSKNCQAPELGSLKPVLQLIK